MKRLTGFDRLPALPHPVVTTGSYDGVHRGHRVLLARIGEEARRRGGRSVVVTFWPHPRTILGRGEGLVLLSTLEEKERLLAEAGIDYLLVAPFTPAFSRLPYEEYVQRYLVGRLGAEALVVGYNHHFGRGQEGDAERLGDLGRRGGFDVVEVPRQECECEKVSSTVIRELIARGEMAHAARLLGRGYLLVGRMGERGELFAGDPLKLLPPDGVYPVEVCGSGVGTLTLRRGRMFLSPAAEAGARRELTFL